MNYSVISSLPYIILRHQVIVQCLELGQRQLLHGMLYGAYEFGSSGVVVCCVEIHSLHLFFQFCYCFLHIAGKSEMVEQKLFPSFRQLRIEFLIHYLHIRGDGILYVVALRFAVGKFVDTILLMQKRVRRFYAVFRYHRHQRHYTPPTELP